MMDLNVFADLVKKNKNTDLDITHQEKKELLMLLNRMWRRVAKTRTVDMPITKAKKKSIFKRLFSK